MTIAGISMHVMTTQAFEAFCASSDLITVTAPSSGSGLLAEVSFADSSSMRLERVSSGGVMRYFVTADQMCQEFSFPQDSQLQMVLTGDADHDGLNDFVLRLSTGVILFVSPQIHQVTERPSSGGGGLFPSSPRRSNVPQTHTTDSEGASDPVDTVPGSSSTPVEIVPPVTQAPYKTDRYADGTDRLGI